jgi:uncharacterized LabA/DUF88 family protein
MVAADVRRLKYMAPEDGIPIPSDPNAHRWMMFVDGENLTFRAQNLAKDKHIPLREGSYYKPDILIWIPEYLGTTRLLHSGRSSMGLQPEGLRAYYYTSTTGDENKIRSVKESLWEVGFQPEVFKKPKKQDRSKGVDIALATDLLGNAYRDNYDAAILVAGDGDYVPLVEEVKRLGKVVHVAFFLAKGHGLSPDLRLASDYFWDISMLFAEAWSSYVSGPEDT